MKINLLDDQTLEIIGENQDDVKEIIAHFRLDPFKYFEEYQTGRMIRKTKTTYGSVYTRLGPEWVQPYNVPENVVLASPQLPLYPRCRTLCHTHIVTTVEVTSQGVYAEGYMGLYDTPDQASWRFNHYLSKDFGQEQTEPEFIQTKGGWDRNPNYARGWSKIHPAATHKPLIELLKNVNKAV